MDDARVILAEVDFIPPLLETLEHDRILLFEIRSHALADEFRKQNREGVRYPVGLFGWRAAFPKDRLHERFRALLGGYDMG